MKKVLAGALIALASVLVYKSCADQNKGEQALRQSSLLIEKQIRNVSKLVVTEGHFAEVYNYADSKELFGPLFTAKKKALVVVNAQVSIAYDLKKLGFEVDKETKTIRIKNIPPPEIKINPDFEYYDVTSDYLNPFGAEDYNLIKRKVNKALMKKVRSSKLTGNAKNRLLSELSQLMVVAQAMGWVLEYQEKPLRDLEQLRLLH